MNPYVRINFRPPAACPGGFGPVHYADSLPHRPRVGGDMSYCFDSSLVLLAYGRKWGKRRYSSLKASGRRVLEKQREQWRVVNLTLEQIWGT